MGKKVGTGERVPDRSTAAPTHEPRQRVQVTGGRSSGMDDLVATARSAAERAYAPYSEYSVGAALETVDGAVYEGCNIENANYSNSLHAEEVALGTAVRDGHRSFARLAVSSGDRDGVTPCGLCRQSLAEFCDESLVVVCDRGEDPPAEYTLGELLPATIDADTLDVHPEEWG